jgi:aminoglycoside 3-N-acetyltransferase
MPAFNWGQGSALVAPPSDEELSLHNAIDAGFLASLPQSPTVFDPDRTLPVGAMGAVPRALFGWPGRQRSGHPLASWLAVGEQAQALTADQPYDDPFAPLRRLADARGEVLLIGVGLRACTALHLAEQRAGRRTFTRWVVLGDGRTAPVRVGGCSDGFDALWPALRDLFRIARVGQADLAAAPLVALVERAAAVFSDQPELGMCDARCIRCRDARLP